MKAKESKMMNMTKTMEACLRRMLVAYGEDVVKLLSVKYEFDAEEGMRYLEGEKMNVEKKEKKDNKKKDKVLPLPYCGKVVEEWCEGVRGTHGLYNQCTNEKKEEKNLCERCEKEGKKNGTGIPNEGIIHDRSLSEEWKSVKGKKATHYSVVMKKLGLAKEEVEAEAEKYGLVIDGSEFEKPKSKRGRKKKETETENENENENEPKEIKQRGRPKKDKTVVSSDEDMGLDLIAQMVKDAQKLEEEEEEVVEEEEEEEEVVDTEVKKEENTEVKKQVNEEAKESKKQANEEAKKKANEEAKEAKKKANEEAKEAKKQAKKQAKKKANEEAKEAKKKAEAEAPKEEELGIEEIKEEGDEIEVVKFEFEGKMYCKTDDNVLYDAETCEVVGMYDEENCKIVEFNEED